MAARKFHIATPEDLQALARFAKGAPGKISRLIRVWTANKRRLGNVRWDNALYVTFSGDRARTAEIVLFTSDNELDRCGELQYNLALQWCKKYLREARDA